MSDEPSSDSRWWTIAMCATVAVCAIVASLRLSEPGAVPTVAVSLAVLLAYAVVFLLFVRRARPQSAAATASIVVTIVAAGVLTGLAPGTAVFQFWMYPLIWVLCEDTRRALLWSFLGALAVFAGFAVSTGDSPDWLIRAAVTQALSFAVNVWLGMWITSVYRYGDERQRLLDELTAAQDELALLHRDAGTTAERARLSRELHDTIAQSLAGTVLLVQRARREQAAGELDDRTLELVEDAARAALAETRALVAGSAPVELHAGGLADAFTTLAARFRRETDVEVTVDVSLDVELDRETEVVLLRCAQEALSNVRKHAHASRVLVVLEGGTDAAVLRVRDDGTGFDPRELVGGFGLSGLRSRLALIGGTLEVRSSPGQTELVATVPLPSGALPHTRPNGGAA